MSARPKSTTFRQEAEMASKSLKELQEADNTGDTMQRLQLLCLSRGARGILGLGRLLRKLDEDGKKHVNLKEFALGLREIGLEITDDEIEEMFEKFDTDGSGNINMEEFFIHIRNLLAVDRIYSALVTFWTHTRSKNIPKQRMLLLSKSIDLFLSSDSDVQVPTHWPPLNESRKNIIEKAFNKIDKTGDGEITIEDLKKVYNVNSQSRYISGEESKENILQVFLDNFEQHPSKFGKVTREEFFNYYAAISASVDNDCYFDLMIRQAYKL